MVVDAGGFTREIGPRYLLLIAAIHPMSIMKAPTTADTFIFEILVLLKGF
jgi:hypothetical protein